MWWDQTIASFMNTIDLRFLPKNKLLMISTNIKHQSAPFVWLFYRMYLAVASVHFLNLTMDWYGGEKELLDRIGPSNKVDMRISPCCCLLCLPTAAQLTRHKIKVLKVLVRQMPYIQSGKIASWCAWYVIFVLELLMCGKQTNSLILYDTVALFFSS